MSTHYMKQVLAEGLKGTLTRMVKDIEATAHEHLDKSPGGKARSAYDYIYETIIVNHRIAHRLAKTEPGPWPFEEWAKAPAEKRNREVLVQDLTGSVDAILKALEGHDDSSLQETFDANGEKSSYVGALSLAIIHMNYHDGQINLVQALHGDDEVHWM